MAEFDENEMPEPVDVPRWSVNLTLQFDESEAATPVDAVSQFLVAILYRDMREMSFTVHDRDSADPSLVQGGHALSGKQVEAKPLPQRRKRA